VGELFKGQGYSTIYYGKWHLGETTQSEPQYHGFDEWRFGFYGSSDGTLNGDNMSRYQAPIPLQEEGVMYIRHGKAPNTPSEKLFPWGLEYRREIDNEMTTDAVAYVHEQAQAGNPFFLFMGLTRPHFPNLPSEEFEGKSRIGGYGDCVMELDHNIGRMMTIRTVGMIKWPGRIQPGKAEGMVSIMDFLPTFANILGADMPDDRPIDGIDQTDYLLGNQHHANREHLITFIGSRIAAVRWQQWRIHLMNVHLTDNNPSLGGYLGYRNETAGYPMIFNIEADPREMRNVAMENTWVVRPMTKIIGQYKATLKDHPNPPAANITVW